MGFGYRALTFLKKSNTAKIILAIFAVIIIITKITPLICHAVYSGVMASMMTIIFQIAFFLVVAAGTLIFAKFKIYEKHTDGRNILTDQYLYHRDQIDLMHHFARDPRMLDTSSMPKKKWTMCEGVIFGKSEGRTIVRPSSADGNILLFASPGVGKTTGQVIPSALCFKGSVFAIDIKGDLSFYTSGKRQIKFFDPDDLSGCHFDPLMNVRNIDPQMRSLEIEKIATIISPVTSTGEARFFEQGAFNLFCGITNYHFSKNSEVTFPEIVNSILNGNAKDWVIKIKSSKCNFATRYTNGFYKISEANLSGCYSELNKNLIPLVTGNLETLLTPSDKMIVPSDLEFTDVYIRVKEENAPVYFGVFSIIISSFFTYFKQRQDASFNQSVRPILMLLDEFPQLHFSWEDLNNALSCLRGKKISIFMICQSREQLIARYGVAGSKIILNNCRYVSIMSSTDPESQRYFADMIGKKKMLKASGTSSIETEEYIIQPEKLADLGNSVVILADGKYIIAEKIKCWQDVKPVSEDAKKSEISPLKLNPDFFTAGQ